MHNFDDMLDLARSMEKMRVTNEIDNFENMFLLRLRPVVVLEAKIG